MSILFACGAVNPPAPNAEVSSDSSNSRPTAISEQAKGHQQDQSSPVTVKLMKQSPGKPPQRIYSVELSVRNPRSEPRWFLFRHDGDDALPVSEQFDSAPFNSQPLTGRIRFNRDGARKSNVIQITFYGKDSFDALRLPAGGRLIFDNFVFSAFSEVSDFEVWEVDSLLVNGRTPVEDWLPYNVLSDRSVHLGSREGVKMLTKETQSSSDTKVEFVKAHAVRKWILPLK